MGAKPIVMIRRTDYGQRRPGRNGLPGQYPASLEQRIIRLKGKYPAWGARRIKHQFNLPCSWRTVHRILKKHGLLIRVKAKPQPAGKRFQRQHVDSMWQGDTFQFRIRGVGKVYVTGFTDDCSRYRVKSKVYLHKDAPQQSMLSTGHSVPDESRVRFISIMGNSSSPKSFKAEAQKHGIKLIFGRPYTLAAAARLNDITRLSTGNSSPSRNSAR